MYAVQPAKKNGESAAAARSWGQRRGVAALGWVRNTRVVERTAPGAPERMPGVCARANGALCANGNCRCGVSSGAQLSPCGSLLPHIPPALDEATGETEARGSGSRAARPP